MAKKNSHLPQLFRKYSSSDCPSCLEVFKSNIPIYFSDRELADFEIWLGKNDCGHFYVLETGDKIVGLGGFYMLEHQARLAYGIIHKDYHKKGLGKALTRFRIKKIRAIAPNLPIGLETSQLTYKYFERFGFRTIEIVLDYYYGKFDKYEMIFHK